MHDHIRSNQNFEVNAVMDLKNSRTIIMLCVVVSWLFWLEADQLSFIFGG
jgi:hypothetical protein